MNRTREAAVATVTPKNDLQQKQDYQSHIGQSSQNRLEKIAERRAQMPRAYRATYDKATKGKSLRAAINAFCQECICFQIDEIRNCTDQACPLYAVRPYQLPQNGRQGHFRGAESKKSVQRER